MNLLNSVNNFINDKNFFFYFYDNKFYFYQFNKIELLSSDRVCLIYNNFIINIIGNNIKVIKCLDNELLISGYFTGVNFNER